MELKSVPGIGDKTASSLERSGISSVEDLLQIYPRTYRHFQASNTVELRPGNWVVLQGKLSRPVSKRTTRTTTQIATFTDIQGSVLLRWFNMPYLARSLSPSALYQVKGQVSEFNGRLQLVSPQLSPVVDGTVLANQLVPIYSTRDGIKPWVLRQKITQALSHVQLPPDPLPADIIHKYRLLAYERALRSIHQPISPAELETAIRRLAFQELYGLQLQAMLSRKSRRQQVEKLRIDQAMVDSFVATLPFQLTPSQQSAIQEILTDLQQSQAMSRLLQGDVGSGKTVIAVAAAIAVHSAGFRTVVMAPTQILANQLYANFTALCSPFNLTVSLMTSQAKGSHESHIIVGTQAVLNLSDLDRIGLVIIDEQHRFGVAQRDQIGRKSHEPHLLQMTATPIPRSVAQTLFHHLNVTRLTELPQNRLVTKTYLVPPVKRDSAYTWIRQEILTNNNQVFVVVPLIEEAEENDTAPLKSVQAYSAAIHQLFPGISVDIMHGRMKEAEKSAAMDRFKSGLTQILVATSMIEVGIDIPEANIIVIEDAERFGLAQLHQLRGRVGRGGKQGYCLLFSQASSPKARERLAYFIREHDGERLAVFDLRSRGPGELFGTIQSGFFNLKLGSLYDTELLHDTYQAAKDTLAKTPG